MFNIKQIEVNIKLTAFFENVWMKSLKFRLNLVKPCEWFIVLHFLLLLNNTEHFNEQSLSR